MSGPVLEGIVSSKHRLILANLLSVRPRTLRELAGITGISIQGVLKHLSKLREFGLLEERQVKGAKYLNVRKVYALKASSIGDYSRGSLMVVNLSREFEEPIKLGKDVYAELDGLAEEVLIQRRRVNDQTRRLQRMIDNLAATESRLRRGVESMDLSTEEKLIAEILFTEDTFADAVRVLSRHFGCTRSEEAVRAVMRKVRSSG